MATKNTSSESHSCVSKLFVEKLIYGITHDLGACSRQMHQFSQLISKQEALQELPKISSWLEYLSISSQDLQAKILALTNLQAISRADTQSTYTDLKFFINAHLEKLSSQFNNSDLILDSEDISANINVEHWNYLITALLQNALTFTQNDQAKSKTKIKIQLTLKGSLIVLSVEDNGIGVRESNLDELGRPFKRFCGKDEYPGLGVGLTICWYIAELNSGNLHFESSDMGGLKVVYQQPMNTE